MARKAQKRAAKRETGSPRKNAFSPGQLRLDLPNYLPYRITSLAALIRRAFVNIYRDDPGLNEPEWKVMTTLAHFGPLPSGDVGHYVTLDRVAVSRALARLIKLGLATRKNNLADQRMFTVDLTPRAARLYDRMTAQALAIEEPILATLDHDEVRALLALLDKVEGCFRSPADRRRQMLMRAAREDAGVAPLSSRQRRNARSTNKAK